MNTNIRNDYMVHHDHMIRAAIRRNWTLLKALRLETEDVYQELAMAMLKAADSYDPARSDSIDAYINAKLQYAVLDLKRKHKPGGMTGCKGKRVAVSSIERFYEDGEMLEVPVCDAYDEGFMAEALAVLTASESEALRQNMDGCKPRTREQRDTLESAREKVRNFYLREECLA